MQGIRHISLDLWLTLIRSNPAFKPARVALFRDHFRIGRSREEVSAAFAAHDRLFNAINEKTGRNLSCAEMLYILLASLGEDVSRIPLASMTAFYEAAEALFFEHPPLWLDAALPATIFTLREAGYSFSILSNTAFILGKTLRRFLAASELDGAFSFLLFSDEMESSKPHCRAYEQVLAAANAIRPMEKSEILHIGDNLLADKEGAAAFGFRSELLGPGDTLSQLLKTTLCTPVLQPTALPA